MAPKKRKSQAQSQADARAVRAAQKAAEASPPLEDFAFLEKSETDSAVPAGLYRTASTDPCRARRPVQAEGEMQLVPPGSFPNPYLAIDFNDKQGIWQEETALKKALDEDPPTSCRLKSEGSWLPAGLRNLGATCYLNSLLQYLFFNLDFRYCLLRTTCKSQVVAALQRVFALLAEGESRVVDPKDFVTAARVDALEQADATEFSALLLDWLQRELADGSGGDFIPTLFEGEASTIVQCSQDPSHTSEKRESFMELRAGLSPVAMALEAREAQEAAASGRKSNPKAKTKKAASKRPLPTVRLEQILQDSAFPEEVLDGSNQWMCPRCDRKVDARRTTRLSKLPPYLHVTVERYHFDAATAERRRLAHPVSFPQRLELNLAGSLAGSEASSTGDAATQPVAFECIGYLEHVSDSAHSGHYRATLLSEGEEHYMSAVAGAGKEDEATAEPDAKRPKVCGGADAAAGAPTHRGSWWRLDDEAVTEAAGGTVEEATATESPERIESSTAYLVLYRRCDHLPGQLSLGRRSSTERPKAALSQALQKSVDEHNTELSRQRKEFQSNSLAVERFTGERRNAIKRLDEELRGAGGRTEDLTFVPATWLERFLRGADRTLQNILEGDASIVPPIYAQSLVKGRGGAPMAIDPLAIWCGEVKILPTAALEQMGGVYGGLDSSTLLRVEDAAHEEVARAAFRAFRAFCREYDLKAKLISNKYTVTDLRAMDTQGQPTDFAVWVSQRTINQWKKVTGKSRETVPRHRLWRHFVREVQECRFGRAEPAENNDVPDGSDVEEDAAEGDARMEIPADVREAVCTLHPKTNMLAGLLCDHGLMCRVRAACLVDRKDMEALLQASEEKDKAFRELWPESPSSARPKLKTGLPGNKLLLFGETCSVCRIQPTISAPEAKRKAPRQAQAKNASSNRPEESEGSAFNNSVFLSSSAATPKPAAAAELAKPPLLE